MEIVLTQKGTTTTCTSAIILKENKVLLGLRHYTPDKWRTVSVWTTPGGRCEDGESIGENLLREIEEETGMKNVEFKKYLGNVPGAKEGDVVHVFIAHTLDEPKLMEPEKFSEWSWFDLKELPGNFINPKIGEMIGSELWKSR